MSKTQTRKDKGPRPADGSGRAGGRTPSILTRRQRRRLGWGAVALVVVVAAVAGGWLYRRIAPLPGEFVPSLGNAHIATADIPHVPYNSTPPTSGPHLPHIAPWGVHTRPIPNELMVHNLEDGGVAVSYQPECADRVAGALKAIVDRYRDHVLLVPYPGLDRCIALTAWTRIEKLDDVDEGRIVRFIDAYRGIDHHAR